MDGLTAAFALAIAQLCIALVMTGAHFAARPERCTGYWALSTIFVAIGVLMVVTTGLSARTAVQPLALVFLVAGGVLQWWGIQVFYGAAKSRAGWGIAAAFTVLLVASSIFDASIFQRIVLLSTTLLVLLLLSCRSLLIGIQSHWTFGSVLTLGAIALLVLNNSIRIAAALMQAPQFLPLTHSASAVSVLYMVPLGGIFLYTTGLLLLYFERLVESKNHLAMHDDMTGILNRRAIVAGGEREVAVAIRNRRPLTVAFVDIDYFKRVNDTLGHEAGDRVLIDVAHLLEDVCRAVDLVGRHGGEEFCLVFPDAGADSAPALGERLLSAIRDYRFDGRYPLTVSIGFASLAETRGERSWANLIHRADTALYQAKALGRDRYCIASQLTADDGDATAAVAAVPASL
jgi:diguanylate cyclase (GGDEF)-like protein